MTISDLHIPRLTDIIDRALDIRESAVRIQDEPAMRQIDRLIEKLPAARLCWQLGVLIVGSPSGQDYHVWQGGCDCVNGRKGKAQCWHWALFNLLLDMLDTAAETADHDADEAARAQVLLAERLEATAQTLDTMRRQLGRRLCAARQAYL